MTTRPTYSPLLELLEERWDDFISGIPDPTYHEPVKRPQYEKRLIREAAILHAQAENSDPFAYGRAVRKMHSGEWRPDEVRKDAIKVIHSRVAHGVIIPYASEETA